jgi:hypothetical protein
VLFSGQDPLTGKNYEHRKAWLEKRLEFLAGQFGIDVLGSIYRCLIGRAVSSRAVSRRR